MDGQSAEREVYYGEKKRDCHENGAIPRRIRLLQPLDNPIAVIICGRAVKEVQ
jgi:hypothetical protein